MTRIALLLLSLAAPCAAQTLPFDGNWDHQGFLFKRDNAYVQTGDTLSIRSDGGVSILYRRLDAPARDASAASWRWSVTDGVPATDLTRKGGDDRDLAVYFVFSDAETARNSAGRSLTSLLGDEAMRVLVYVRGGAETDGRMLPSPYLGARGMTIRLRPAASGAFTETVDLDADLRAAFGDRPPALIGVAISADSDDTDSRIEAKLDAITLE